MYRLRVRSWQWGVGGFLFIVGGMMLVAPHQLATVAGALPPSLSWWGVTFLLGSLALFGVSAFLPPTWYTIAAHLLSSALLLALTAGYLAAGRVLGVISHAILGAGCLVALASLRPDPGALAHASEPRRERPELFPLAIGLAQVLIGATILVAPSEAVSPDLDPARPYLPAFAVLFLFSGAGLVAMNLRAFYGVASRRQLDAAYVLGATTLLAYACATALPNRNWPGMAFFGWFGLALLVQPWLNARAIAVAPGSLRLRLALLLAIAVSVPLLSVLAVVTQQVELSTRTEALQRQEAQSVALAGGVENFVMLHGAALDALAAQPGLATMPREDQVKELKRFESAFPDLLSFALYGPDGSVLASSDEDFSAASIAGHPDYEQAMRTGKASMDVLLSSLAEQPVFGFTVPLLDEQGQVVALVSSHLESTRLVDFLVRQVTSQVQVVLFDEGGRVIAHPDPALADRFADLSAIEPVATILSKPAHSGSLTYASPAGMRLAGYARVPDLGWIVLVERSESDVLSAARRGRDFAFAALLLFLASTAAVAFWLAGWVTRPLASLAAAVTELAAGNPAAPLPRSRILETQRLTRAFGQMREALAERTAELSQTAARLLEANEALNENHVQLLSLSKRLLEVQENERRAIARELHDETGQAMTTLKIGLGLLKRDGQCSEGMLARIDELRRMTDQVLEGLHRLAMNLRPASLDRNGLVPALEQLIQTFSRQTGLDVDFSAEGLKGHRLPGDVESSLYRVVQEALTNVVRHAQAKHACVILGRRGAGLLVIVEDDGIGFDADEALRNGRLGLLGMRERVEMLGGVLTIESQPGSGTTVYVHMPWPGTTAQEQERQAGAQQAGDLRLPDVATAAHVTVDLQTTPGQREVEQHVPGHQLPHTTSAGMDGDERKRTEQAPDEPADGAKTGNEDLREGIEWLGEGIEEQTTKLMQANEVIAQKEMELHEARRTLEYQGAVLQNVSDAVIATDAERRIRVWNRASEELYGWTQDEAMGQLVSEIFKRDSGSSPTEGVSRDGEEGGRWRGEMVVQRKDGVRVWIEATSAPIRDQAGRIIGRVGVNHDITERKCTEDSLQDALQALEASREQLQALSRRLVEVQERERQQVADQLLNQAGQVLAALKLELGVLAQEPDCGQVAKARLETLREMANQVLRELHRLAVHLRPASLDRLGLVSAIGEYLEEFGQEHGLHVRYEALGSRDVRVPADVETALYRIVQEALQNVAQHARASAVDVVLNCEDYRLAVVVEDDGIGFYPGEAMRHSSLGLLGMRERAEGLGGRLTVESKPGLGTGIFVEVPVDADT